MRVPVPFITSADPASARAWRDALNKAMPEQDFADPSSMSDADAAAAKIAVVANPSPDQVARFADLEWVQSVWAGVDRLVGVLPSRVRIVRLIDPQLADTMAEGVLGHVLYLHRRIPEYLAQQRAGLWQQLEQPPAHARTVAVLGLGALGQASAERLRAAGFRVVGWSRSRKDLAGIETFAGESSLATVLNRSDIVVVLVPLTPDTTHLLNARTLGTCRPGAALINVARGAVVDTSALIAALDTGRLHHAVLDVFDEEPLPQTHALWAHPSLTILPHVAAPTDLTTASRIVARNLRAYFETGAVPEGVSRARGY